MKIINLLTKNRRGMALVTVLVFIPIFLLLLGCIIKSLTAESYFLLREKRNEQVFYITESGVEVAYFLFSANNFGKYTHQSKTTKYNTSDSYYIGTPTYPGFSRVSGGTYDGWIKWEWDAGDAYDSMLGTSYHEEFMYQIYPSGTDFVIRSIGKIGFGDEISKSIVMRGTRPNLLEYTLFDNDDLSEFVRGQNQTITGKVHANGILFMRPSGTTLRIKRDANSVVSVTSADKIIASRDAWDRTWASGSRIYIDNSSGSQVELVGGSSGTAYDHEHAEWADNISGNNRGALDKWGGVVKDSAIGGQTINTPNFKSFTVGGYYDEKAKSSGLRITSNGATYYNGTTYGSPSNLSSCLTTGKTFYNGNECRTETVVDIDVSKMLKGPDNNANTTADTIWPSNGVIYAETPVRLINADTLPGPLTIVSPYNVYVNGDFNKELPTQADFIARYGSATPSNSDILNSTSTYTKKKAAAICTTGRIFFLSKSWKDSEHTASNNQNKNADDPVSFTNEKYVRPNSSTGNLEVVSAANIMEVNAAMIDGPPTVDERYFRKDWGGVTNPHYNKTNVARSTTHNTDDLLEQWGSSRSLRKRGSIIHLQSGQMAPFDNSGVGLGHPGVIAWITGSCYDPPYRDYGSDPSLATNHPPEFPRSGQITSWQIDSSL